MAPPQQQQQDDTRSGSIIGAKWRVDSLLGSGSMASVYAVTHRNGSRAALKILHESLASDVAVCERFLGEGYLTNSIKHSGIVRVFDDGMTDDGCPFLAMDLLEGETLDLHRTKAGGKLQMFEVIDIADKVMDTLAAVHQAGIIHRDLKPQNVFCENEGGIRLLDFGVARLQERMNSHSVVGMVLGTPSFMSPEQALGGKDVDARSDIWALGAIMFTLLTGETVHVAANIQARLLAAASVRARSVLVPAPDLPQDLALVIDTALQFKKDDRWQTVNAMRQALRNVKQSLPPPNLVDVAFDSIRQGGPSLRPATGGQFALPQPHMQTASRGPQNEGPPTQTNVTTVVGMSSNSGTFTSAPPIEAVTADKRLKTALGIGPLPRGSGNALPPGVPVPGGMSQGPSPAASNFGAPPGSNPGGPNGPNTARGLGDVSRGPMPPPAVSSAPPDPRRAPYESLISAAESAGVPAAFGNTNAVWAQVPADEAAAAGRKRSMMIVISIIAMLGAALVAFAAVAFIKRGADDKRTPPGGSAAVPGSGSARLGASDPGSPFYVPYPVYPDGGRGGPVFVPSGGPQPGNTGGTTLPAGNNGTGMQLPNGGPTGGPATFPGARTDAGVGGASDAGGAGAPAPANAGPDDAGSIELW
jgi:serine/threonine-protein kinase